MKPETETLLAAEPPSVYDFNNWDDFYRSALRYHNATRPNDQRVIDRIETFREFMSPIVLEYLGGFVVPHPRYNTTEGWDSWVSCVREKLRGRDESIGHAGTVDGWIAQFKERKANEREFWQGLDRLVGFDEISSEDQRNIFWDTLSWEAQQRLVERCPYFDPANEVWTSEKPGLATNAEQKLSQIMEFSIVDEQILLNLFLLKAFGFICSLSAIISVLIFAAWLKMENFGVFILSFILLLPYASAAALTTLLVSILAWIVLCKVIRLTIGSGRAD